MGQGQQRDVLQRSALAKRPEDPEPVADAPLVRAENALALWRPIRNLRDGTYLWYVWPGFGDRERGRYGRMLGSATFFKR